ncbi:MAG: hypothetical protein Q9219_001256 [cf. Caloplaca sp. 3 TL-2023]
MAYAPPAVRDNFLYNGDLYVDVGNFNRHKRASVAEIMDILRPDLRKAKHGVPVKDPVGHWYEAQLIHYGLPPSKDKARAKMRLLENLNSSNLKVPSSITAIESELKKEFAAAERKAKAQHKAAIATSQSLSSNSTPNKKRKDTKTEPQTPIFNVNINFGPSASPMQDEPQPAKKRKIQTARRGGSTSVPSAILSRAAPRSTPSPQSGTSLAPAAVNLTSRPKQTARRSASSSLSYRHLLGGPQSCPAPAKNPEREPKAKCKPAVKREPSVKKAPGANQEPTTIKQEIKVKAEPNSRKMVSLSQPSLFPTGPSLGLINGIYDISCPELEQEFNCSDLTLVLTLDTPSVWGAYDFGMFSGITYISERPYDASGQEIPFSWRGREHSEGEMSFGEHCQGGICFTGDGFVQGWINLDGVYYFQGLRRPGPGTPIRNAASMRAEWEAFDEQEYEPDVVEEDDEPEMVESWGGSTVDTLDDWEDY